MPVIIIMMITNMKGKGKAMDSEFTTIKIKKSDAEDLKRRFSYLRTDALRMSILLKHYEVISVSALPHPPDAELIPLVLVAEQPA
jgi:hypothetical protein